MGTSWLLPLVYLAVVVWYLGLQLRPRPVKARTMGLPLILALVFAADLATNGISVGSLGIVAVGGAVGLGIGAASGNLIRVYRDSTTGQVFRQGDVKYVAFLVAVLLLRYGLRFVLGATHAVHADVVDAAFIALFLGNMIARTWFVQQRALSAAGGNPLALQGQKHR